MLPAVDSRLLDVEEAVLQVCSDRVEVKLGLAVLHQSRVDLDEAASALEGEREGLVLVELLLSGDASPAGQGEKDALRLG